MQLICALPILDFFVDFYLSYHIFKKSNSISYDLNLLEIPFKNIAFAYFYSWTPNLCLSVKKSYSKNSGFASKYSKYWFKFYDKVPWSIY